MQAERCAARRFGQQRGNGVRPAAPSRPGPAAIEHSRSARSPPDRAVEPEQRAFPSARTLAANRSTNTARERPQPAQSRQRNDDGVVASRAIQRLLRSVIKHESPVSCIVRQLHLKRRQPGIPDRERSLMLPAAVERKMRRQSQRLDPRPVRKARPAAGSTAILPCRPAS